MNDNPAISTEDVRKLREAIASAEQIEKSFAAVRDHTLKQDALLHAMSQALDAVIDRVNSMETRMILLEVRLDLRAKKAH